MDFEELINAVVCRPQLWNKREVDYCKRAITETLWDEIAEELDATKDDCRKKWKYLKDEYRKALRKYAEKVASGNVPRSSIKSRFKYFDQMTFIKEDLMGDFSNETSITNNKPTINKIKKRKHNDDDNIAEIEYLDVEDKKFKPALEQELDWSGENSDLSFLKSLLPFFKDMSLVKKLTLRSDIQNLIVQALLEDGN